MDTAVGIRHLSGGTMSGVGQQEVGARMPQQNHRLVQGLFVHHHQPDQQHQHPQYQQHLHQLAYPPPPNNHQHQHHHPPPPLFLHGGVNLHQKPHPHPHRPSIAASSSSRSHSSRGPVAASHSLSHPQRQSRTFQVTPHASPSSWYGSTSLNPTGHQHTFQLPLTSTLQLPNCSAASHHYPQLALSNSFSSAQSTSSSPVSHTLSMAADGIIPTDDLARFQEMSNTWEPEFNGPLVSERLSSSTLTQEYANADPVYQIKTASLPSKYQQYRTVRGDGHCGWRALAFCYFETLMRIGDKQKFSHEEVRLKSMSRMITDLGHDEHLFEDFVDNTLDCLQQCAVATDNGAQLLRVFNDSTPMNQWQGIIAHLKLLTSVWIQKHPNDYEPFMQEPLQEYLKLHVEPSNCEIDQIGLSALIDLLCKPAGIAVEVLYLDRSPGNDPHEIDSYRWDPLDQYNNPLASPPTIRLLYRPGHYDILYKQEDISVPSPTPPPAATREVMVALQHRQTEHYHASVPFGMNDFEIPGLATFPPPMPSSHAMRSFSQYDYDSPPVTSFASMPTPTRSYTAPTTSFGGLPPNSLHQDIFRPSTSEIHSTPVTPSTAMPPSLRSLPHHPMPLQSDTPFRRSKYEIGDYVSLHPPFCQTSIFKNSHYNPAHFLNPEFKPEQWRPDEYNTNDKSRKKTSLT